MRTLLVVTMDVAASNKALADGSLPKLIQSTMDRIKPEAAYFYPIDGHRAFSMVFDLKDSSDIASISEPFFSGLNAKVDFRPVMNIEDLQKGLRTIQQSQ